MSTSLRLLFLFGPDPLKNNLAMYYDELRFNDDYQILGQIIDLSRPGREDIPEKPTIKTHPIPVHMWVWIDDKKTRRDKYDDELTFVYAEDLKKLKMPTDVSPKNKAIKAFIDALPNDIPIILEWC